MPGTLTQQARKRLHQQWGNIGVSSLDSDISMAKPPLQWARENATLAHPTRGLIPFEPYDYQAAYLDAYDEPRRFVLKARQIGFSQVFAIEAVYTAIHTPQSTVLLVSRTQALATNMLRYCLVTYHNLRSFPRLRKRNQSEMEFANGSRILSLPANPSAGRGYAATVVYLDEFAYADYDEEIYQSISPTLARGGRMIIASTPDGRGNLFAQLWQQQHGFVYFYHPWHHCPRYYTPEEAAAGVPYNQAAWYIEERPKYTAQQWAAEFDCDFVMSGLAVFRADDIDQAVNGAIGEQSSQPTGAYLISVDVGRRQDATVINVFDASTAPIQRVHHVYIPGGSANYPLIAQEIEHVARSYGGALVIESNGVGDPLIENLAVPAEPFVTSSKSKTQAIQSLQLLLEQGRLKAEWTPQERRELMSYQWNDKALQQDCVMSLAIGAYHLTAAPHENYVINYADDIPGISGW